MFEKESNGMTEEERTDFVIALKRKMCLENGMVTDADVYFQGVKDGYNKANEWHFVKEEGEYPKEKQLVMLYRVNPLGANIAVTEWYDGFKNTKVIAWKEIVLPELPKESE